MDSVTFSYSVLSWWAFGVLWAYAPAPESLQGPEPYDVPALKLTEFSFVSALIDKMNIKMTQSLHVSYKQLCWLQLVNIIQVLKWPLILQNQRKKMLTQVGWIFPKQNVQLLNSSGFSTFYVNSPNLNIDY